MYDLVQRINEFSKEKVQPAIARLRDDKSRIDPNRDAAIFATYIRLSLWSNSLQRLNKTADIQAVGTGARCIFEHYIDIAWLCLLTDANTIEQFKAFPNIDRYHAAQKIILHKRKCANSTFDTRPHEEWVTQMESQSEPVANKVGRLWGTKGEGIPKWPRFHWTGIRDLSERSDKLGLEYLDEYYQIYTIFSSLVHAGPTAFVHHDFSKLELNIGYAYFKSFQYFLSSIVLAVDHLRIKETIPSYDEIVAQMKDWLKQDLHRLISANQK
jgi:hypothetical protein